MGFEWLPQPQGGTGMCLRLSHQAAGALLLCSFFWQPAALARGLSDAPAPGIEAPGESMHPAGQAAGATPVVATATSSDGQMSGLLLPEGTELQLEFIDPVSSRTAVAGDRCNLRLRHDLRADGVTVIARGALAVGTVIGTQKRGLMGRGGHLILRIDYLLNGDERIALRGNQNRRGDPDAGARVAISALFGPLSLLKRGRHTEIPKGATMRAYLDRNQYFTVLD